MNKLVRPCLVLATMLLTLIAASGVASAVTSADATQSPARPSVCVAVQTAQLLKAIDREAWLTRASRAAAVRDAIARGKSNCAPKPYGVRVEAVQGRDPVSGTLRISCRGGFELSPTSPPGAYFIRFGALTPDSATSVTRTARTATSYAIDYTIQQQTPAGGGLYLEGTCVSVQTLGS